jgi:hypothetical protein
MEVLLGMLNDKKSPAPHHMVLREIEKRMYINDRRADYYPKRTWVIDTQRKLSASTRAGIKKENKLISKFYEL